MSLTLSAARSTTWVSDRRQGHSAARYAVAPDAVFTAHVWITRMDDILHLAENQQNPEPPE